MKHEINPKLYNWASDVDPAAVRQAERTARLPVVERVALVPDAHVGLGATVGSVIGTRAAIIPAAVGVDIGCGMCAVELDLTAAELPDDLDPLLPDLGSVVPAGVGRGHDQPSREAERWLDANLHRFATPLDRRLGKKALEQFGSLGSGNHFLEVCLDEADRVWVVLHSGSRGIGNLLARDHIEAAKNVCRRKHVRLDDADLAYLEAADAEFGLYVADMLACQDYARANRDAMMGNTLRALGRWLGRDVAELDRIDCHHNFTERETHAGRELWVTRKGAIRAESGDPG